MPQGEPKFPTWAPSDVIEQWRHEAAAAWGRRREYDDLMARRPPSSPRPRHAALTAKRHGVPMLLQRLLTDDRMRPVWERLTRAEAERKRPGVPHTEMFAASVIRAWLGPIRKEERWTPTERNRWLRDFSKRAWELADKIEGTGVDEVLSRQYLNARTPWVQAQVKTGPTGRNAARRAASFQWDPGRLSTVLRSLSMVMREHKDPREDKTPVASMYLALEGGARKSPREYFVRYVGEYLSKALGRWDINILTATAAVALEDQTIGEHQVYRLLEQNKSRPRPNMPARRPRG